MMRLKTLLLIFILQAFLLATAETAETFTAFAGNAATSIPLASMAFHPLEKEPDYSENWYFFVQQDQGGYFTATLTVTNVGLGTFDGYLNISFDPPTGDSITLHREYRRKDINASDKAYDLWMGNNRAWGKPPQYHLRIREGDFTADLTFTSQFPPYRRGDGKIVLGGTKKEFALVINAPRANVSGSIVDNVKSYPIHGTGYHDHDWETFKITDFSNKGCFLHLWHDDLTLIFQDIYTKPAYGGGKVQLAIVAQGPRVMAQSNHYTFEMTRGKQDPKSGYVIPEAFAVDFKTDDVQVSGTLHTVKLLQSMDVLAVLSWPVRKFVETFYTKSWIYRIHAKYDLVVTTGSQARQITGETMVGVLYY